MYSTEPDYDYNFTYDDDNDVKLDYNDPEVFEAFQQLLCDKLADIADKPRVIKVINGVPIYRNRSAFGTYIGELKDGEPNGFGIFEFTDGICYKGNFQDGLYYGYGVLTFSNGQSLSGNWVDSDPIGVMKRVYETGQVVFEYWKNGERIQTCRSLY